MSFTPITLTGGPYTDGHGTPLAGWVILRLMQPLSQPGGATVLPTEVLIPLDGSGSFSRTITATNDPATQQIGAVYQVVFETGGGFSPASTLYIGVPYDATGGTISINDCPWTPNPTWGVGGGGSGGGGGGSGGGSSNDLRVRKFPLAHNTPGILTGDPLFTPAQGDQLIGFRFQIDVAFDGLTPTLDIGSFIFSATGILGSRGAQPIPLWVADTEPSIGVKVAAPGTSLASALATAELTSGAPTPPEMTFGRTGVPMSAVISQDGSNAAATRATVAGSAPTLPVTISGSNNQFAYNAAGPSGHGSGALETFTVPSGTYSTLAALAAAMAASTGSVSGERFDTVANVATAAGAIVVGGFALGAAANGNQLIAGTNDALGPLGFATPSVLGQVTPAVGGDPGSTQGSGVLYVVTATPA